MLLPTTTATRPGCQDDGGGHQQRGTLSASWAASDPETAFTLCCYAVRMRPGGTGL